MIFAVALVADAFAAGWLIWHIDRNACLARIQAERAAEQLRIAAARSKHTHGAREAQGRLIKLTAQQLKLETAA